MTNSVKFLIGFIVVLLTSAVLYFTWASWYNSTSHLLGLNCSKVKSSGDDDSPDKGYYRLVKENKDSSIVKLEIMNFQETKYECDDYFCEFLDFRKKNNRSYSFGNGSSSFVIDRRTLAVTRSLTLDMLPAFNYSSEFECSEVPKRELNRIARNNYKKITSERKF